MERHTEDVDYLGIVPYYAITHLEAIAGMHSELSRKHRLYVQAVMVTN